MAKVMDSLFKFIATKYLTPVGNNTIWHSGNYPRIITNATINNSITVNTPVYGHLTGGNKEIVLFLPYPVTGGTPSMENINLVLRPAAGGYCRLVGTSSYIDCAAIGSSRIWENGAETVAGSISRITYTVKANSGLEIHIFTVKNVQEGNNTVTNNSVLTGVIAGTIKFS